MNDLLDDLLLECKEATRSNLPLVLKNTLNRLDIDESDLCLALNITDYNLEDIMFNDKTVNTLGLLKLKSRLIKLIKRSMRDFEVINFNA